MRTVKVCSLLLALCWSSVTVFAQYVSEAEAKAKAMAFWKQKGTMTTSGARKAPRQEPQLEMASSQEGLYVFNDQVNGGYVVVSGDERMPAILGYSYTGHYDADDAPESLKSWIHLYAGQVAYLQSHPDAEVMRASQVQRDSIQPLLGCAWSQEEPYYNMCPKIGRVRAITGCVATAMAQIMYYWKWPKQTTQPIPAYTTSSKKINVPEIPVTTIAGDNMLPDYSSGDYTQEQADAVATLMMLCGSAVKMDYKQGGSGASTTGAEFVLYFDYEDSFEFHKRYYSSTNADEWDQMIYDELAQGRPVLYAGFSAFNGHEFVIDGYARDGFFHINMGWGVASNDYFLLTAIKNYNDGQQATIKLCPSDLEKPKAYAVFDQGTLSFHYDHERDNRQGDIYYSLKENFWSGHAEEIEKVVIDPSFADVRLSSHSAYFANCKNLTSIEGIEYLNTSASSEMGAMFSNCSSLVSLDLSHFNTENVSYMGSMFYGCSSLKNLDLSGFDTKNVYNMWGMFCGCTSLESVDLSHFNTENVKEMWRMFENCPSLTILDLGKFNTGKVTDMGCMFENCSSLSTIYVGEGWKIENKSWGDMFINCEKLVGGNGTRYETLQSNSSDYAHIDEGPDNPGYLTSKKEAVEVYDQGMEVCRHYAGFAESEGNQLNDSISRQQSENTILASSILNTVDSVRSVIRGFEYLTEEERALLNQQIGAIEETVNRLKEENDTCTVPSFTGLLEYAKEPMDTLRDSLTVYHAFLYPVRVTGQELDSVATAFAGYIKDIEERYLTPLDSAVQTLTATSERLTEIAQELAIQLPPLSKLSEEISLVISDVKGMKRQGLPVIVYTLDGRQRTMTEEQLKTQPKGLYILKGRKRMVK